MTMSKFIEQIEKVLLILIMLATLVAVGAEIMHMIKHRTVELSDLLLLFIYAEVMGMLAAYYNSNRIPVTLPLIIGMTALSRMIILQSKELDKIVLIYESGSILLLSIAALIMSIKDKYSLDKLKNRIIRQPD